MEEKKKKRNFIEKLKLASGVVIEEDSLIQQEIIGYFENLYLSDEEVCWGVKGLNWNPISEVNASWLERPFELEEIKRAVFTCGKDKTPGPDGFSL